MSAFDPCISNSYGAFKSVKMNAHSLVKTFNNDGYKNTKLTWPNRHTPEGLGQTEPSDRGSFVSYSSFKASIWYKLYNAWTLDNATDTTRSGFTKPHNASPDDRLYSRKTVYHTAMPSNQSIIRSTCRQ